MKRETRTGRMPTSHIHIIGGTLKRSRLAVLDRPGLRPTPGRVRETVFNWIAPRLAGSRCVDCFAGTGALGFEALSRGAAHCTFIESDPLVAATIQSTIERLQLKSEATVIVGDLFNQPEIRVQDATLIFADPPFHHGLSQRFLTWIAGALRPDSRLILESGRDEMLDLCGLDELKILRAGIDCVRLLGHVQ